MSATERFAQSALILLGAGAALLGCGASGERGAARTNSVGTLARPEAAERPTEGLSKVVDPAPTRAQRPASRSLPRCPLREAAIADHRRPAKQPGELRRARRDQGSRGRRLQANRRGSRRLSTETGCLLRPDEAARSTAKVQRGAKRPDPRRVGHMVDVRARDTAAASESPRPIKRRDPARRGDPHRFAATPALRAEARRGGTFMLSYAAAGESARSSMSRPSCQPSPSRSRS